MQDKVARALYLTYHGEAMPANQSHTPLCYAQADAALAVILGQLENPDLINVVLKAYNGGMVREPDAANPRNYTTYYKPRKAMELAMKAVAAHLEGQP